MYLFLQSNQEPNAHLRLTGVNDVMGSVYSGARHWLELLNLGTTPGMIPSKLFNNLGPYHQVLPAVSIGGTTTTTHAHATFPHLSVRPFASFTTQRVITHLLGIFKFASFLNF